jgi:hypothetical protein
LASRYYQRGIPETNVSFWVSMVTTFSASNIEAELEVLVDNWLTDVQRRGAELYAVNRGPQIVCLSFEGKGALRYTVKIDYAVKDVRVQITGPRWIFVERNAFLLNAENLRSLSTRMCLVGEGQAVIPVYLLAQLSMFVSDKAPATFVQTDLKEGDRLSLEAVEVR